MLGRVTQAAIFKVVLAHRFKSAIGDPAKYLAACVVRKACRRDAKILSPVSQGSDAESTRHTLMARLEPQLTEQNFRNLALSSALGLREPFTEGLVREGDACNPTLRLKPKRSGLMYTLSSCTIQGPCCKAIEHVKRQEQIHSLIVGLSLMGVQTFSQTVFLCLWPESPNITNMPDQLLHSRSCMLCLRSSKQALIMA